MSKISIEGGNLEALLERVIQMNMIIIEEMQEQRKHIHDQKAIIASRLSLPSSTIVPTRAAKSKFKKPGVDQGILT
jgi:hypothetical protein